MCKYIHILILSLLMLPTLLQANWVRLDNVPEKIYPGEGIVYGGGYVWAIAGEDGDGFYAYDIQQGSWVDLEPCEAFIDGIGAIEYETGYERRIFVVNEDELYFYTKLSTTGYEGYWEEDEVELPDWVEFGEGTCIAFQYVPEPTAQFTGYLYLLRGNSGSVDNFFRRAIEEPETFSKDSKRLFDWETLEPIPDGVMNVGAMCYVKRGKEEGLYVYADDPDNAFYYYSINSNTWEIIGYTREQYPGSDIVSAADIWQNDALYSIFGETHYPKHWLYNIPHKIWLEREEIPLGLGDGASLAYYGEHTHDLYLVVGIDREGRGRSDFLVNRNPDNPDEDGIQLKEISRLPQNAKVTLQSDRIMIQYSTDTENKVIIQVHDLSGKCVKKIFQGNVGKGEHRVSWNKTDKSGKTIPAGIYFITIEKDNTTESTKIIISK